jgi:predicted SprT family Zn-dependent metalloprotease
MCQFQARVDELMQLASQVYAREFKPVIAKDTVRGLVAGWAMPCGTVVDFNLQAAERYPQDFDVTVIHEVAHAVDIQKNGYRRSSNGKAIHHDAEFYSICRELGDPEPNRTHEYNLRPSRIYREFEYQAMCDAKHNLKIQMHNKLQKGIHSWVKFRECGCKVYKDNIFREIPRAEIEARYVISGE